MRLPFGGAHQEGVNLGPPKNNDKSGSGSIQECDKEIKIAVNLG